MPRKPCTPTYRLHRPTGLAVVTLSGKDHYLGPHGSPESEREYHRLVAEWLDNGRSLRPPAPSPETPTPPATTVNELILAFWRHCETYYRTGDGKASTELDNVKEALKPLRKLYGTTPARSFGPLALRAVRASMVESGLARTTVNARVHRIRRAFRWAASVEMVPGSLVHDLDCVDSLKRDRTEAPEPEGIEPVAIERVEKTLPFLSKPVAAMVRLQLLTSCRAGEVMAMCSGDIHVEGDDWEYRPGSHKNAWRGQKKVIPLGPKAREIIREFLKPNDPAANLFDPRDVVAELHGRREARRKTRRTPSEKRRRKKSKPGSDHAGRYDRRTYRQAIVRACDRAFPHPTLSKVRRGKLTDEQRAELKAWRREHRWSPLQLRHTAATELRARYGLEAAQAVLGHKKPETTTIYAERDLAKARAIMGEVG